MTGERTLDQLPEKPIISRFVAPWDTSGWYYVSADFHIGSQLYANASVTVTDMPLYLCGGDHIVTYDSHREGFDDKQGCVFFCEREDDVYVALPKGNDGAFLEGFAKLEDTLSTSEGLCYELFVRRYHKDDEVRLPSFTGDCPHYFSVICPATVDAQQLAPVVPRVISHEHPHMRTNATWYLHTVFHEETPGSMPACFSGSGAAITVCDADQRRKMLRMNAGSKVFCQMRTSGCDVLETEIHLYTGRAVLSCCGVSIALQNGAAQLADGSNVGEELDGCFSLRFARSEEKCEVWLNSRLVGRRMAREGSEWHFSATLSEDALAEMTRFSLRDRTDLPCVTEKFTALTQPMYVNGDAVLEKSFLCDECDLRLNTASSALRTFPSVDGVLRVETTVKPHGDAFTVLLQLHDKNGNSALQCAMMGNNLYASDGRRWRQVYGGHISGMYYPCANWYRLAVVIDLLRQNYDLYIDGALRVKNCSLMEPVEQIAQASWLTTSTPLSVCDLRVYDRASSSDRSLPPAPVFDVTAAPYMAVGDGVALDTEAIQRALDDAAYTGGTVLLPRGTFLTGELFLRSETTMWIAREAKLLGAQDHELYPMMTPCGSLCANRQLGRGLIYGEHLHDVRITGGGTIDGNGHYRYKMNDPISNREKDARPDQIYIACSETITLEDLSIVNSAFWSVVPLSCRNVLIERLYVDAMNTPNRDGIDPVDCIDMTVRDCCIVAGDDGLCFKSSDDFGCRNIDASNLVIQSLASGIKFGTDSYHSFANVRINNCILKNINRCGVSLEAVDGAQIKNIQISHLDICDAGAPMYVVVGVRNRLPCGIYPERYGSIANIRFDHVRYAQSYRYCHVHVPVHEVLVIGEDEKRSIKTISFSRCHFTFPGGEKHRFSPPAPLGKKYPEYDQHGSSPGHAFTLRYAYDVSFENCIIELLQSDARPQIAAYHVEFRQNIMQNEYTLA